jgi:uncharacterized protein (TIGR03437 family)
MKTSLLLVFLAAQASAQTAGTWTQKSPATSPPPRSYHAMAYDSAHGQVVLFGGMAVYPSLQTYADTWVWDGTNWTQKMTSNSPTPRSGHAMAYDSAHGQVVLFGGFDPNGNVLNDTWVWDGNNWTQEQVPLSPPPRAGHGMAYDTPHGQVVLFGGTPPGVIIVGPGLNTGSFYNDTWLWNGTAWTQASPATNPTGVAGTALAYDSTHQQTVLFGGNNTNNQDTNQTWVWNGVNWTQKLPQPSPPARDSQAMTFDSVHGQTVIFGGSFSLDDTWVWDGTNWTQEMPQTSPPALEDAAMAFDSAHGQAVLFGAITTSETWIWVGAALVPSPTVTSVISASGFGGAAAAASGSWVEIYGSNLASTTRQWGGSDFNGNNAPTSLSNVEVTIGGQKAFVYYISPGQVDAQVPSNIGQGPLPLTLTNASGTSTAVNLTVNATEPGLLATTSFKIGGNQYVVAQLPDGNYVLPAGSIAGVNSRPAMPGETIVVYGIGFGSVTPSFPAGQIVTQSNQLVATLEVQFAQTPAQLLYAGLAPSLIGLYQFNIVVPAVADSNLVPFTFSLGGVNGTQTVYTAVQQ